MSTQSMTKYGGYDMSGIVFLYVKLAVQTSLALHIYIFI